MSTRCGTQCLQSVNKMSPPQSTGCFQMLLHLHWREESNMHADDVSFTFGIFWNHLTSPTSRQSF